MFKWEREQEKHEGRERGGSRCMTGDPEQRGKGGVEHYYSSLILCMGGENGRLTAEAYLSK